MRGDNQTQSDHTADEKTSKTDVSSHSAADLKGEFHADVTAGLSKPQKTLPCRWLYDKRGSELFEAITELPEYYPTRTEIGIFRQHLPEMATAIGYKAHVIEFGAGAGTKTRMLLDALKTPASYVAIDISADFLAQSMAALAADYPALKVVPLVGDFMNAKDMTAAKLPDGNRLAFFPGSTIGNLLDEEIITFLRTVRTALGSGGRFLVGFDLVKSEDILVPAYDDAAGVTAAFNLNLLTRINRELDGSFDLQAFTHEARWNAVDGRIEMHLVSQCDQSAGVNGNRFDFRKGETIHTENSRKFKMDGFRALAAKSGWSINRTWTDDKGYFAVALME